MRFRNWLMRFMAGRCGADQLNRALNIAALVLLVLSFVTGGSAVGSLCWALALACLLWGAFRTFSERHHHMHADPDLTGNGRRHRIVKTAVQRQIQQNFRDFRQIFHFSICSFPVLEL